MKQLIFICMLTVLLFGCAKRQLLTSSQATGTAPAAQGGKTALKEEPSSRFTDWQSVPESESIYFDFDKSELLPAARESLKKNADYLRTNGDLSVLVEGNCDERGTVEYNLALGERRAAAVRDYYSYLGIAKERVALISYGKEKPVDPGHNEAAWAKNRRADTKIRSTKQPNS